MSHVRYCVQVYGSAGSTTIGKLQKVFNFAARIVSNRRKYHASQKKSRLSLWSITSVMLNGKTWFMRHSHCNDMAKQTCRMRRATQSTLRTGGAQVEHPCSAAPWAGWRSLSASLRCRIICGVWLVSLLAWSLPWLLPCCNCLFVCTRAFI